MTSTPASNLPWVFACEPQDYFAWVDAVNSAPEARGLVAVDDPEPEALLPSDDFDDDGEILLSIDSCIDGEIDYIDSVDAYREWAGEELA